MKKLEVILVFLVFVSTISAQPNEHYTISGYVREAISGESLIGVNIYLKDRKTGTVSNTYGFYSLTLPASDSVELFVSYIGFETENIKVPFHKNINLNINLKPNVVLKEVIVSAERREKESESVKMSTVSLQPAQIKNVPSLLGEKDVLKVLQLMPGVQKGTEGSSGLYVRGGGPDQNLIILDDAIVYNASHLFGFFSLFNGDALKSVELTKGGFPARYGGRLSSVLDMNMKEGNKQEWHGEAGIGLISSRLTVEGPLIKGKSSIILSGRRTYADLLLAPFMKNEKAGYNFYDFNAKINYDFGRNNKLYLSGYFGQDRFTLQTKDGNYKQNAGFHWGNSTGTLRWNHLFNNKLFSNASAIYSKYNFGIYAGGKSTIDTTEYYGEYYSGIRDYTLKYDIDWLPNPKHWIKAGVVSIYHRFNPHAYVEKNNHTDAHIKDVSYIDGIESGIYAEDTLQPFQQLKVNGGLRFSHFKAEKNQYHYLEPRLSLALRLKNDIAVKGSYASMNQYVHMLSNTGISLPTDLWVPTTDRIRPQRSQQVALGMVKDFKNNDLTFSIEGYYKNMTHVIGYKEGTSFIVMDDPSTGMIKNWEETVTAGRSWSYGVEFLLRKNTGRLTGWIGYTLSWTQMQFDSLNFGRKFYARYDRRHDISVVGIYKLSDHISLSGTWVYGTGNAVTLPNSEYLIDANSPDVGQYFSYSNWMGSYTAFYNEQKNNFRMAPYHRLDLGIQFHKQKKFGERIWDISVYNVYNRMNPFFYYLGYQFKDNKTYGILKQVTLFPIIPSFSYSLKF